MKKGDPMPKFSELTKKKFCSNSRMLISNMAIVFLNWQSRNTQISLSIKKFVYEKTKIVYLKFLAKYPNRAFLPQIWSFFCRARNIAFVKIPDVCLKYDNSFFKPLPKYPNKTFLISNSIFFTCAKLYLQKNSKVLISTW